MAKVTGLTAARMLQIENQTVVGGRIENDELILERYDGQEINSGIVKGDRGNSGETPAVLKIDSTNGNTFKNNEIATTLVVTVFYGSRALVNLFDIIDVYGPGVYLQWKWKKEADLVFYNIPLNDPRLTHDGFQFDVGPSDVDTKTIFQCSLMRE